MFNMLLLTKRKVIFDTETIFGEAIPFAEFQFRVRRKELAGNGKFIPQRNEPRKANANGRLEVELYTIENSFVPYRMQCLSANTQEDYKFDLAPGDDVFLDELLNLELLSQDESAMIAAEALLNGIIATHEAQANPHEQYLLETEFETEIETLNAFDASLLGDVEDLEIRVDDLEERADDFEAALIQLNNDLENHTHTTADISDFDSAVNSIVSTAVAALVNAAPTTLDQLDEIAAALGNNPNFATDTLAGLGLKLSKASNLSDLQNIATARTNLGFVINGDGTQFLANDFTYKTIDLSGYAALSGANFTAPISATSTSAAQIEARYSALVKTAIQTDLSGNTNVTNTGSYFTFNRQIILASGNSIAFKGGSVSSNTGLLVGTVGTGMYGIYGGSGSAAVDVGLIRSNTNTWKITNASTGYGNLEAQTITALNASGVQLSAQYSASVKTDIQTDSSGNTLFINTGTFYRFNKQIQAYGNSITFGLGSTDYGVSIRANGGFEMNSSGYVLTWNTAGYLRGYSNWQIQWGADTGIRKASNGRLAITAGYNGTTYDNSDGGLEVGTLYLKDGTIKQVTFGAADSGGTGKKVLVIDN